MNAWAALRRNGERCKGDIERGLFRGNDGITERGGGHTGPDGRTVRSHHDGFREVQEGVKQRLIVGQNEGVELLRVHRLDGGAQVHAGAVVGIRTRQYQHLDRMVKLICHWNKYLPNFGL